MTAFHRNKRLSHVPRVRTGRCDSDKENGGVGTATTLVRYASREGCYNFKKEYEPQSSTPRMIMTQLQLSDIENSTRDDSAEVVAHGHKRCAELKEACLKATVTNERRKQARAATVFESLLQSHRLNGLLGPLVNRVNKRGRKCVGSYELIVPIGKGGYSQVWEARDANSPLGAENKKFAVKIMAKAEYACLTSMDMLADEISLLKQVKHKNLISMHDVMHDKRNVYIVMERAAMDVIDYETRYGDRTKCEHYIRTVLRGILAGVAYLHHHGIAHMDLKTDNILILRDVPPQELTPEDIRICDLGLCVIGDPSGNVEHNSVRGTHGLMAPEVHMSTSKSTTYDAKRADIWSVGVILMDLLHCTPGSWMKIFEKRNWNHCDKMLNKAMHSLCRKLEMLDSGLSDLLLQMLNVNPKKRLTVNEALNHRWLITPKRTNTNCLFNMFDVFFSKSF